MFNSTRNESVVRDPVSASHRFSELRQGVHAIEGKGGAPVPLE